MKGQRSTYWNRVTRLSSSSRLFPPLYSRPRHWRLNSFLPFAKIAGRTVTRGGGDASYYSLCYPSTMPIKCALPTKGRYMIKRGSNTNKSILSLPCRAALFPGQKVKEKTLPQTVRSVTCRQIWILPVGEKTTHCSEQHFPFTGLPAMTWSH